MRKILIISLLCIFSYASVGKVVALKGGAYIKRANKTIKIYLGTNLEKKDKVITNKRTKLQIRFNDNTIITVGKNSQLLISDYLLDEEEEEKSSFAINFIAGIFKTISGKIGKLNPDKFKLKTKTASIGIRGTRLIINAKKDSTIVACTDGSITVESVFGDEQDVDSGEFVMVRLNERMTDPQEFTRENFNKSFNQYQNTFSKKFSKFKNKFTESLKGIKTFKEFKNKFAKELKGIDSFKELKLNFQDDLKNINSFDEMLAVFSDSIIDIGDIELDNININLLGDYIDHLDNLRREYNTIIKDSK
jgi:hypothetical protein